MLKGRQRAIEKLYCNYDGDATKLTDLARSSIVSEDFTEMHKCLERILRKG
jgi:hypothetical protein